MSKGYMENKLVLLNILFAVSLVTANTLAGKVIMVGGSIVLPAAVITYAFTFLLTDIIHEQYGRQQAQRTVLFGFIAQVFASVMIFIGLKLPVAPFAAETQGAYEVLLGQNYRFVIASFAAYFISQNIDIYLFSYLKGKTNAKHKWLRNNASTFASQFIDTTIFITIAFYGTVPNIWIMIVSQFGVKLVLALIDTPLFYLFTKTKGTGETGQEPYAV
ncbi:queuosine precursor transporter [Bacillus marinisedimentorum]|uniref:queuosine precursor transporter n=1 Tax=Bacillus marinisedimentorum TaxID=1821260 RepID=UPI0007DEA163|nr:queuosine precursor transporter [Bacillus marinisedimentorum]